MNDANVRELGMKVEAAAKMMLSKVGAMLDRTQKR